MARKYETVEETHKTVRCWECSCDICGKAAKDPATRNWGNFYWEKMQTTVECYEGYHHKDDNGYKADDAHSTTTTVDICPKCFNEMLLPFLKSLGAKPTIKHNPPDWEEQEERRKRRRLGLDPYP